MTQKTIVIALGGNSLIRDNEKGTIEEQYAKLLHTSEQIMDLLKGENRIVITHGNGPQVGNLLVCFEAAKEIVPSLSLDICDAATQGLIGYMMQLTIANSLRKVGLRHNMTTVLTQVIVDKNDLAFKHPSKPIGPFYSFEEMEKLRRERGWEMIEDANRGYRRVVPSPLPISIQQTRIIESMLDMGEIVIAVGGGGIPMVREKNGDLVGVEAVIDKDLASARLAIDIQADSLLILTGVEKVYRSFRSPCLFRRIPSIHSEGSRPLIPM